MDNLPLILLAVACPLGMVLMMVLMGRGMMGMGKGEHHEEPARAIDDLPTDPDKRLAVLQAQRALLDAQISAAEQPSSTTSKPRRAGH